MSNETNDNPYCCPICDQVDEDGLEACSRCYNSALEETANYRRAYKDKCDQLHELRLEHIKVSTELVMIRGSIK